MMEKHKIVWRRHNCHITPLSPAPERSCPVFWRSCVGKPIYTFQQPMIVIHCPELRWPLGHRVTQQQAARRVSWHLYDQNHASDKKKPGLFLSFPDMKSSFWYAGTTFVTQKKQFYSNSSSPHGLFLSHFLQNDDMLLFKETVWAFEVFLHKILIFNQIISAVNSQWRIR